MSTIKKLSYFIIYKPYGIVTQFSEMKDNQTLSALYEFEKDIYPVGRLDADSEGLLILTNDNYLKTELIKKSNEHKKKYLVQIEGFISDSDILKLENGVTINIEGEKYITKKCEVKRMVNVPILQERNLPIRFRKNIPTEFLEISITEGKNRQIRKMTASAGHPALRLIRTQIDDLLLSDMKTGEVSMLSQKTIYKKLHLALT